MNETLDLGYIYELVCSETGNSYYGSTSKPHARYLHHRGKYNQCVSRHLINPTMNIIEIKENITRNELEWIEKHYILNYPCINKQIPKRTRKEYYKAMIKENPDYNKDKYIEIGGIMRNERTRKHCECGGKYIQRNLKIHLGTAKHKKYISNTYEL